MFKRLFPTVFVCRQRKIINYNIYKTSFYHTVTYPQKLNCFHYFSVIQTRNYAKGKDKKKTAKGKKIVINEEEMCILIDVEKLKAEMNTLVESLKDQYLKNLSLRSTTGAIDFLKINLEGNKIDLMEVARIIRSTPGTVILDMSSAPHAIPAAIKAISHSGMNLNPRQDGSSVYVPIPRITKEYREGLVKNAKSIFIKCRDNIKEIQNKYIKLVKAKEKEGLSEDLVHRVMDQVAEFGSNNISLAEKIFEKKQKELME